MVTSNQTKFNAYLILCLFCLVFKHTIHCKVKYSLNVSYMYAEKNEDIMSCLQTVSDRLYVAIVMWIDKDRSRLCVWCYLQILNEQNKPLKGFWRPCCSIDFFSWQTMLIHSLELKHHSESFLKHLWWHATVLKFQLSLNIFDPDSLILMFLLDVWILLESMQFIPFLSLLFSFS